MGFSAAVPCPSRICRFRVPLDNRELQISTLNHKPVNRIAGNCSADFTPEFLHRCHKFPIVEPGASLYSSDHRGFLFDLRNETGITPSNSAECWRVCHTGLTTFTRILGSFKSRHIGRVAFWKAISVCFDAYVPCLTAQSFYNKLCR